MLVAPGVSRVRAPNPSPMTGDGTNTYLIGGAEVAVIDPGPALVEHVDAVLAEVERRNGRIGALLVSHAHQDHLPAAFLLRERTGAPILGHASIPDLDRPLADGATVRIGAIDLTVFETPGHAGEHVCFWAGADRLLFSGDLIAGAGTVVLSDEPGSLNAYLASLRRVAALGPSIILPGHGPVVADGRARVDEYLAHRVERDRQILRALRERPLTVDGLVKRIYRDTPPALQAMAARNVRAHLERLAERGEVRPEGHRWSPTSPDGPD